MKKHFLTLALLFGMVISYAGNNTLALKAAADNGLAQETTHWVSTLADRTAPATLRPAAAVAAPAVSCQMQFKGTINGVEVNLTIKVDGISCRELLRTLANAM